MENSSFKALHEDQHMEILSRLPLKSLMICMCVSTKWASLIRSKEFRKIYLSRSMTRPRLLFVAKSIALNSSSKYEAFFHSVYQKEEPLLSSGQQKMRTYEAPILRVSQPIRGLICHQRGNKIVICNPGSKKFMTLPEIQAPQVTSIRSLFGYDKVRDVFKVLCITSFIDSEEYHVFTVGSDEESWRRITCNHDHLPDENEGLFIGDALYYGTRFISNTSDHESHFQVMKFDVSTEVFSVIKVPEEVEKDHRWKLVNYKGEIALVAMVSIFHLDYGIVHELHGKGVFEMWVWNETAKNWWRNRIEIPHWEDTVVDHDKKYYFKGTIGTGELVFAPYIGTSSGEPLFVLYYDTVTRNLRRYEVEGMVGQYQCVRTFLDHVDSTWLM